MPKTIADSRTPARRWASSPVRSAQGKRNWPDVKAAVENNIRKYPLTTVVVGLVAGVVLGWFIKRR